MTLNEFVAQNGIQIVITPRVDEPSADFAHLDLRSARHWTCEFWFDDNAEVRRRSERFTCAYTTGGAPPTATEVLGWLAGDARTVLALHSFEEWAEELDLNPDSRREERRYQGVRRRTNQLKQWLGARAFRDLLSATEEDGEG